MLEDLEAFLCCLYVSPFEGTTSQQQSLSHCLPMRSSAGVFTPQRTKLVARTRRFLFRDVQRGSAVYGICSGQKV